MTHRATYYFRREISEAGEPVFLRHVQTAFLREGLVKLVVIGEFEFREQLVDRIHVFAACRRLARGCFGFYLYWRFAEYLVHRLHVYLLAATTRCADSHAAAATPGHVVHCS